MYFRLRRHSSLHKRSQVFRDSAIMFLLENPDKKLVVAALNKESAEALKKDMVETLNKLGANDLAKRVSLKYET